MANALLLMVNLQGTRRYANHLAQQTRSITWFPAARQHPDDALSQRLLGGEEPVVLMCRASGKGAFVCCGRLQLVRWTWDGTREWEWALVDWEKAAPHPEFQSLLLLAD